MSSNFPEYINSEFPEFVKFIDYYFEFMSSVELIHSSNVDFSIGEIITSGMGYTSKVVGVDNTNNKIFITSQNKFKINETIVGENNNSTTIVSYKPNSGLTISELLEYRDPDTTLDTLFKSFRADFMAILPEKLPDSINKSTIIKKIRDLYKEKGTTKSFKLLFKLLFNEYVEIKYPAYQMLRTSNGEWVSKYSFIANVDNGSPIDLLGKNITITDPGADPNVYNFGVTHVKRLNLTQCEIYIENKPDSSIVDASIIVGPNGFMGTVDSGSIDSSGSTYNLLREDSSGELIFEDGSGIIYQESSSENIIEHGGEYKSNKGFLSDNNFLQNNYYQLFSYTIESNIPSIKYKHIVKNALHPAGLIAFHEMIISNVISISDALRIVKAKLLREFYEGVDTGTLVENLIYKFIREYYAIDYFVKPQNISDEYADSSSDFIYSSDYINYKNINKVNNDLLLLDDDCAYLDSNPYNREDSPYATKYFFVPSHVGDEYTDLKRYFIERPEYACHYFVIPPNISDEYTDSRGYTYSNRLIIS
jgi:hypothetical protein